MNNGSGIVMSYIHKKDCSLKLGLVIIRLIAIMVNTINGTGSMNPKKVLNPFNLN